jgi:HSP20 family protein
LRQDEGLFSGCRGIGLIAWTSKFVRNLRGGRVRRLEAAQIFAREPVVDLAQDSFERTGVQMRPTPPEGDDEMETKLVNIKRTAQVPADATDAWKGFRSEIENALDRFSNGFGAFSWRPFGNIERLWPRDGFVPLAMDVTEDDKGFVLTAELPGIDEKNVSVTVKGDSLVIEGEKSQEKEEKSRDRYLSERSYGSFKRCFALPDDVDPDKIKAQFAKGVLAITLPKTATAQSIRKIDVKAA